MKNKEKSPIKYSDLWGLREEKYEFLNQHDVTNIKWKDITPKAPQYFFVPKNFDLEEQYNKFLLLTDIFDFYSVGGKPGDDSLLIGFDQESPRVKVDQTIQLLKIDPSKATKEATKNLLGILDKFQTQRDKVIPYNYRPFDIRYTYYDERIYTRPVSKIKKQFEKDNIALLTTKILKAEPFAHTFVTNIFPDVIFLSNKTSTNTFVFPLRVYNHEENQQGLFGASNKISGLNFSKKLWKYLEANCEVGPAALPEDIFYYIYAVLFSNVYRQRYQEFLKIDFPKIPFARNLKLFQRFAELGKQLVDLHLLKSAELDNLVAKFYGQGDDTVGMSKFIDSDEVAEFHDILVSTRFPESGARPDFKSEGVVLINDRQLFGPVSKETWNYHIGGYQVLNKWLKDRKGRVLSSEDIKHYCKIVGALSGTIKIQNEIDRLYPEVEKNSLNSKT